MQSSWVWIVAYCWLHFVAVDVFGMPMTKHLFDESGPKCLDGTSAGYYLQSGSSSGFVVYLKGGGGCKALEDCTKRKSSDLGSSKKWSATRQGQKSRSDDKSINPDFYSWNHIYVPYCSGDSWIGEQTTPINPFGGNTNETFLFQGHLIVDAVVKLLQEADPPLTHLLLTGSSAGGIGTFFNADYFTQKFPNAVVKANPNAGWFGHFAFDRWSYFVAGVPDPDPTHMVGANITWYNNISAYTPEQSKKCAADPNANKSYCNSIPQTYKYIKTPIFVTEAASDKYQVQHAAGMPVTKQLNKTQEQFILHFGDQLRASLIKEVMNGPKNTTDGLFTPACYNHVLSWKAQVFGISWPQALGNWYFGRPGKTLLLDKSEDFYPC